MSTTPSEAKAYGNIGPDKASTSTLERAWALMLVKSLWPTIDAPQAKSIADWMCARSTAVQP